MADKPVTREEKYLAYLTGDYTGEIPKPITRKEKYLYELCLKGMGGEASPEEIKAAVNEYLEKNPVKPGATAEQVQQIEQNKTDIASLKEETGSLKGELSDESNRATERENEIEKLFTMPTQEAVNTWLDEHPEATTTVQDHSLSIEKMVVGTLGYVTPEMFGAKGDGVTDDTEPVQNAVNSGFNVRIDKTYRISSIKISKPLMMFGNGTLKRLNDSSEDTLIEINSTSNGVVFDGIVVDGVNQKCKYSGTLVNVITNNVIMRNCCFKNGNFTFRGSNIHIYNCRLEKSAVALYSCKNATLKSNYIDCLQGENGIDVISDTSTLCEGIICDGNYIVNYTRMGIEFYHSVKKSKIINNTILSAESNIQYYGISVDSSGHIDIVGNIIEDRTTDDSASLGIEIIYKSSNIFCCGNTIIGFKNSIRGDIDHHISIKDNKIVNCKNTAIDFIRNTTTGFGDIEVSGNEIILNPLYVDNNKSIHGIKIGDNLDFVTVSKNRIFVSLTDDVITDAEFFVRVIIFTKGKYVKRGVINCNYIEVDFDENITHTDENLSIGIAGNFANTTISENNIVANTNKFSGIGAYGDSVSKTMVISDNIFEGMKVGMNFIKGNSVQEDFFLVCNNKFVNVTSKEIFNGCPHIRRFKSDKNICFESRIPTTGNWKLGDIILNTNPSVNGVFGWVCVEAGTPGNWAPISIASLS